MKPLDPDARRLVRCPRCRGELNNSGARLTCTACGTSYPTVNSIPILIDDERSVFRTQDFVDGAETYLRTPSRAQTLALRVLPDITARPPTRAHFERFVAEVRKSGANPTVLVVGGGIAGVGMEPLLEAGDIRLIESDASMADRTQLVCDAHQLPFADSSLDGVVTQAVLEHLVDPFRAAGEIERVLKPNGVVYAAASFMQQVHGGPYDFYRFTHLGMRRLFAGFDEIESGAALGPGSALAWAWQYFLLSFVDKPRSRNAMKVIARITAFWPKYFDRWLSGTKGGLDAASAVFFLGRKGGPALSDRELASGYRGASG
jgi:SAM-dependent methyltransferase